MRGPVCKLAEQVLSPAGFLANLRTRNLDRLLAVGPDGVRFTTGGGGVRAATLTGPRGRVLRVAPRHVALTAGAGNAELLSRLGLPGTPGTPTMQRRPLHMTLVRGADLPPLNGHCVDGAKTRVTVTSDTQFSPDGRAGRVVWQVGGQLAEDGVNLSPRDLIARAASELAAAVPGVDLAGCEWATYRVDRAEGAAGGVRPDDAQLFTVGNVHACWPTKLALAPVLAARLAGAVGDGRQSGVSERQTTPPAPADWPRPAVAAPPWETCAWAAAPRAAAPLRRAA